VVLSQARVKSKGKSKDRRKATLYKLGIVIALIGLWEAWRLWSDASPVLFPSAFDVLREFSALALDGTLAKAAWGSLLILASGLFIGVVMAFILAGLAISLKPFRYLYEVLTSAFNPLPAIGLFPLAIMWFGLGTAAMLVVMVHSTIWQMATNTFVGFTTISRTTVMVARNLGLSRWKMVLQVLLPSAYPYILAGLRLSWAFGWRTVIAAELVFGSIGRGGGIGYFIYVQQQFLRTSSVLSGLLVIVLLGLAAEWMFLFIERRTVRKWGMSNDA